jgi:hypothetical protein
MGEGAGESRPGSAVLPSFLTGVLGGSAATLGLIQGLSDALLGIAKLISGPWPTSPSAGSDWPAAGTC